MSEIERKNGWQLAEHAREATPYGMQRLLSTAVWDDGLVREDLRDYVYEHLGTPDGILVIDETSFPKRGDKSAGVQEQYCGTKGELDNCQVAVFLDYVTNLGHTLIDCELYIPKQWIDDRERCREAGIPDTVGFKTKCELARLMVERVSKAGIPISWVVADTVYGENLDLRTWLEAHRYRYVLAVASNEPVGIRAPDGRRRQVEVCKVEALLLHDEDWQRLSMGDGAKGPRLFDWACVPTLHKWEDDGCHWLLIRRSIDHPEKKDYYFIFGLPGTTLQMMVKAIGYRWRIEDDFQTSKAMGLDHYEVRSFLGWYRHITLIMIAHAFLAIICAKAQNATVIDAFPSHIPSSVTAGGDASCPVPVAYGPPMPSASELSPSLPALPTAQEAQASCILPASSANLLPAPSIAPLSIPEVRHLLGCLIWPTSANAKLVLAWSRWRRCHRGMAGYYHTKRRLEAG